MPKKELKEKKSFEITNKGMHLTFPNGVTVSVQWGIGNYCDNKDFNPGDIRDMYNNLFTSNEAEVAIFDKEGNWITRKYTQDKDMYADDVLGYVDILEFFEILEWAKDYDAVVEEL